MLGPEDITKFWIDEVGPEGWYSGGEELDAKIRERFAPLWKEARDGGLHDWLRSAEGTLAYLILTDQMSRNMFRDEGKAFETDEMARAAAKLAIDRGYDMKVAEPQRQFFYMPLMHSECLTDQDRCVRMMLTRMPETGASNLVHAKVHREIIRRFGRFPYRNTALNRHFSSEERDFVDNGGYRKALEDVSA